MADEEYRCESCEVTFASEEDYEDHAREAHDADV